MVNNLGGKKLSSEMLFHEPSVFVNLLPFNGDEAVAVTIQAIGIFSSPCTPMTAECPPVGVDIGRCSKKFVAARRAGEEDHLRILEPF
jgi:hypothetical protein